MEEIPKNETTNPAEFQSISKEKIHYYGFDYLRAIFCIGIVIWHSSGFGFINEPNINYLFVYYYGLLGVPVFFQLSLFLYVQRTLKTTQDKSYFKKRMKDLAFIYVFWLPVNWVINTGGDIAKTIAITKNIVYFLLGNNTHLYYLCSLILLTATTQGVLYFYRFNTKRNRRIFVITIIGLFTLSLCLMVMGYWIFRIQFDFPLGYANPLNFIPYVFSSIILALYLQKSRELGNKSRNNDTLSLIVLLILSIAFALVEKNAYEQNWFLNGFSYQNFVYFSYARFSLVFSAMFLILITFRIKRRPPKSILFISDLSLGIYVTHVIFLNFVNNALLSLSIIIHPFLLACIVFLCTTIIVYILKTFAKKLL